MSEEIGRLVAKADEILMDMCRHSTPYPIIRDDGTPALVYRNAVYPLYQTPKPANKDYE